MTITPTGGATPRRYTCHGITLTLRGESPRLLADLDRRLRYFSSWGCPSPDVSFDYHLVGEGERHRIDPPCSAARPVYDSPAGEVLYEDSGDRLYLACGDRLRVQCELARGQVRVSLRPLTGEQHWLVSHPLFTLPLIELFKRRGRFSLHAAGVCRDGRALLFPGTSGAGKSTLALALARAGFGFLSDDLLFLSPSSSGPRVLGFPDELDLTEETLRFFPELRDRLKQPKPEGWRKRPVRPEECGAMRVVSASVPVALVFPRIAGTSRSVLRRMEAEEALLELIPNVLLTEAASSQAHLDSLAALVAATDQYRLETGTDFDQLPALLAALLERKARD